MTDKLNAGLIKHLNLLIKRYPILKEIEDSIAEAYRVMEWCYVNNGKLLIAGNGGSAADAEHIVGELMKGFKLRRKPALDFAAKLKTLDPVRGAKLSEDLQGCLPAIALTSHPALNSAYLNDVNGLEGYAQQVYGYGQAQDVFLGISTSGNSKNILYTSVVARAKGMKVIALTGAGGGELAKIADVAVQVPETETYIIQELHLPIYHCWCLMLEEKFFGVEGTAG